MFHRRTVSLVVMALALALCACDSTGVVGGRLDGGPRDAVAGDAAAGDADDGAAPDAMLRCRTDQACDDRVYCNGQELCLPGHPRADLRGCVAPLPATPCLEGQTCDEPRRTCNSACGSRADADGDGHRAGNCGGDDCDDADPNRYPGRAEVCDPANHDEDCDPNTFGFRDSDMDSHPDGRCCNVSLDGTRACGDDCNDSRPDQHPGLAEACDGADNDCDGEVDEGVQRTFYPDGDGDGFGSPAGATVMACFAPRAYAENSTDCDDANAAAHPGAVEVCDDAMVDENCDGVANPPASCTCIDGRAQRCAQPGACAAGTQRCAGGSWGPCSIGPVAESCNGIDDNCDGAVDEMLTVTCFADADNDGYPGAGGTALASCPIAGRESVGGCPSGQTNRAPLGSDLDCADTDPARRPAAAEACNGVDDNCDGAIDEGVLRVFYPDADGDLFGDGTATPLRACTAPAGYVENAGDCDDTRASRSPSTSEICDGVDNNCNGQIDEAGGFLVFADMDRDSWGDAAGARAGCGTPPAGYAIRGGDCDDTDPARFPGAPEVCDNRDNDCNAATYYPGDLDRDGHDPVACGGNDCNESDPVVYGGAPELCDRKDNNCSSGGAADTGEDGDNDRHAPVGRACTGGPFPRDDCDDTRNTVYGGATEFCNGIDDNCDGAVDELPAAATSCGFRNSVATCASAACRLLSCVAPYLDCNRTDADGCEVDPRTDRLNCGGCGLACTGAAGGVYCVDGACSACPAGRGDCDGNAANGCETDLTTSGTHCGACGRACAPANGSGACVAGACTVASCRTGYGDCNALASDGCESNFANAIGNCGRCGNTCLFAANSTPTCLSGVCGAGPCIADHHRCGTQCVPNASAFSCGTSCVACPGALQGSATCNATTGACGLSCLPGTGDCDGIASNACETALLPGEQCCAGRSCAGRCVGGACLLPDSLIASTGLTCGLFADHALRCQSRVGDLEDVASFSASCIESSNVCSYVMRRWSDGALVAQARSGSLGTPYVMGYATAGIGAVDGIVSPQFFAFQPSGSSAVYTQGVSSMAFSPLYGGSGDTRMPLPLSQIAAASLGTYSYSGYCGLDLSGDVRCVSRVRSALLYSRTDGAVRQIIGSTPDASSASPVPAYCLLLASGGVDCLDVVSTSLTLAARSVPGITDAVAIAGERTHYCALRRDGSVACWGRNTDGLLGDGTSTDAVVPVAPSAVLRQGARALAVGSDHTCVVQADGRTMCWGSSAAGRAGGLGTCVDGNQRTNFAAAPWPAPLDVSIGLASACVLRADGVPLCAGSNNYGQLGDGTTSSRSTFLPVLGITDAVSIVVTDNQACTVLRDGSARCWGENSSGALGDGTVTSPRITPRPVSGLSGIAKIALGSDGHGCAILTDRTVWCWGTGTLGDGVSTRSLVPIRVPGITDAIDVSAGIEFTCVLRASGDVLCWGANNVGQLGNGTSLASALPSPVLIGGRVTAIASGYYHSCALLADGTVSCWGTRSAGQLGDSLQSSFSAWPVSVPGIVGADAIATGSYHACARFAGGWSCWGLNNYGQLGVGDQRNRSVPSRVGGLSGAHQLRLGMWISCALDATGAVMCTGGNNSAAYPRLWPAPLNSPCYIDWSR
jgi:alpha-tubulin suppressor-like RCC1 family protein